jgi:hypothetical protein
LIDRFCLIPACFRLRLNHNRLTFPPHWHAELGAEDLDGMTPSFEDLLAEFKREAKT